MPTEFFNIDCMDTVIMEDNLRRMGNNLLPKAVRQTLRDVAFVANRMAKQDFERDFINRNQYSKRSIMLDLVDTNKRSIDDMRAIIGSALPYMEDQEFGNDIHGSGKTKPIPTQIASGETGSTSPRRKVVRSAYRLSNINLRRNQGKYKAKTARQANFFAAIQTLEEKNRFVFITQGHDGTDGIYEIRGRLKRKIMAGKTRRSKTKGSWEIEGLSMKLIYNMEKKSVKIAPKAWLLPASKDAQELTPSLYRQNMQRAFDKLPKSMKI